MSASTKTVIGLVVIALLIAAAAFGLTGERDQAQTPNAVDVQAPPTENSPTAENNHDAGSIADFDYYVLVLSWSPTHCASERGRGADDDLQCRSGRPYGFVLHGLWPQYERGYPQNCASDEPRKVASELMDDMLKISPSAELVQHEWEKHGTCSGLSQVAYFAAAKRAFESIAIPSEYERLAQPVAVTPEELRGAFVKANRTLSTDAISATCRRNELAEIWICLDRALAPRSCAADVGKRHCRGREVRMRAVRGNWPR